MTESNHAVAPKCEDNMKNIVIVLKSFLFYFFLLILIDLIDCRGINITLIQGFSTIIIASMCSIFSTYMYRSSTLTITPNNLNEVVTILATLKFKCISNSSHKQVFSGTFSYRLFSRNIEIIEME
ncbi:MAG: hypothetical protein Q8N88_01835, partial [Nanoarchaeota archaeon]|nr:hypothetical protein [Nanoarchaeota archaeon]